MKDDHMLQVEINGVKMEIDTRHARRIETLRVGSRVKVLKKESYGNEFKVYPGVVVGFDEFKSLPTISVCYLQDNYMSVGLEFVAYNAQSKDVEIVAATDADDLELNKSDVLSRIDRDIEKKHTEIAELEQRREFFLGHFKAYFAPVAS